MINFFQKFFFKNPKINLWIYLVIALISLALIPEVKIGGNFSEFSAGNDELQAEKEQIENVFKNKNSVFLQIEYQKTSQIGELIKSIVEMDKQFTNVFPEISTVGIHNFKKYLVLENISNSDNSLKSIKKLARTPVVKHLISTNLEKTLLVLNFKNKADLDITKIDRIIDKSHPHVISITPMGEAYIEEAIKKSIGKDIVVLGVSIFILSIFMIWFAFKSIKAFVLVMGVLIGSAIPVPLVLYLFNSEINVINLLLIPIIMILALSDSIHLLNGMADVGNGGKDRFLESFKMYIIPSFYTSLTSSLAFMSFMVNDIEVIRVFGLMSALVVILGFFSTFVLSYYLTRILKFEDVKMVKTTKLIYLVKLISTKKKFVSIVLLLLFLGGVFSAEKVEYNTSGTMFFPKGESITKVHDEFNENFASLLGIDLLVYPARPLYKGDGEDVEYSRLIAHDISRKIELIENVKSVSGIHEFFNYYYNKGLSLGKGETLGLYNPFLKDNYTRVLIQLEDPNHSTAVYREVLQILKEYKTEVRYHLFSAFTLYDKTDSNLTRSMLQSILISFGMIFIVFYLISRSIALSFISLLVNFIVIGMLGGLFVIFDMKLNVVSAMACIINIGIVVDDTIHVLYKFKNKNFNLRDLSYGMLITTLTLSLGFCTFLFSSFNPTIVFGVLSSTIIVFALLADLTLLPYLREKLLPR